MKNLSCLLVLLAAAIVSMTACAANKAPPPYRVTADSTDHACALGAAAYAQVYLTNAGLFDQTRYDADKTDVLLLAKKPVTDDLWESVYFMTLHQKDGKSVSIITVSTNTSDECSVEDIKTYVVSDQFGELPPQTLSADTPDEK